MTRWHSLIAGGGVALAALAAYAAGLHGPFLMDDFESVLPLAAHQATGATWNQVLQEAPGAIRMRWLSNATFLLSRAVAGNETPVTAFAFKAGNFAVHLACALLLVLLARRLARAWGDEARATGIALLAAGAFVLHPLLVSTVLYPVQRSAQLSTFFLLAASYAYLRWRQEFLHWTSRRSIAGIVIIAGLSLLALLAKENGVLAPLLFGVLELTALRAPAPGMSRRREYDAGFGVLCAGPLAIGVLVLAAKWQQIAGGYANRDFTLTQRLLTEVHALGDYAAQIIWPRIAGMGLYRDDFPLTTTVDMRTGLLIALWVGAASAALVLRRRLPALAFGLGWFLAAHALESTLVALELVFEHRNYLALPGIAIAIAWMITRLHHRPALMVATFVLALLATQTARRVQDWSSYDRFIRSEAAHHPGSLRAASDLVGHLAASGRREEARAAADAMERRFPDYAQPAIVGLWLECANTSGSVQSIDWQRLREGNIDKSSLHLFGGLRDRKIAGRCEGLTWSTLASVAGAAGSNPHLQRTPRDVVSWARLQAGTAARASEWAQVREALERALHIDDSRPEDWLLRLRSAAMLRDREDYRAIRLRLLHLTGGRAETLGPEFSSIEEMAARVFAAQ